MIYLCRHGETEFNREDRLQGHMESDLTALGQRQAAAMADLLHDLVARDPPAPWRLISSPLKRAQATAGTISARLGLEVELEPRLIEISVGAWEGRLRTDVARDNPSILSDPTWFFRAPGGETYDNLMDRIRPWLAEQADEARRRLIVVSHGVAGRLLRGAYANLEPALVLRQVAPQDAIYRLSQGQIDRLACEPVS